MGGRLQSKTEGAYLAPCLLILQSSKDCPLHFRRSLASGKVKLIREGDLWQVPSRGLIGIQPGAAKGVCVWRGWNTPVSR
jgi:hypothetical protein